MSFTIDHAAFQTETPTPASEPLTFDQPVGTLPIVDDARWSAGFTDSSGSALLVWVVMLLILQIVGLPIARRLFARFPDAGWGYARIVALALGALLVWFPSAMQWTEFRASWVVLSMAVVGAGSWYIAVRRRDIRFRFTWSTGAAEAVFWIVFAGFLLLRFMNPDSYEPSWGGEKPMEFAHLNAILRSAHFPPVDPWYSGGFLNYYYYGTYLVAYLIKLTGIPVEIAFNLALPTILAMLASGMFSLGTAIGRSILQRPSLALVIGAVAAVFSVGIGNLVGASRVYESITAGEKGDSWMFWVWGPTRIFPNSVITEFPYFAGLYGDLHAHTIALPFTVLILALGYARVLDADVLQGVSIRRAIQHWLPTSLLLGALLGTLFMTNAWDAPAYAVLTGLSFIAASVTMSTWRIRIGAVVASLGLTGIGAVIVLYPFNTYYVALFSDIQTVPDKTPLLPIEAHWGGFLLVMTAGFATLMYRRSNRAVALLDPLLVVPALAIVLIGRWYAAGRSESLMDAADYATVLIVVALWLAIAWVLSDDEGDFAVPAVALRVLTIIGGVTAFGGMVSERPVFALYIGIGVAAGVVWLGTPGSSERVLWATVAVGMLLGGALELIFLVDDLANTTAYRMNTVFKFYNQLWTLFAIASAGCVAVMLRDSHLGDSDAGGRDDASETRPAAGIAWSRIGLGFAALTLLLGFAYPTQATGVRLDTRFPHPDPSWTLDAYAWMEYGSLTYNDGTTVGFADDLAAIDWFNAEVPGTPVIAEASFGPYRCNGSRFSIATGLPAVIGWQRHEQQQRDPAILPRRERDLFALYATPDVAEKLEILNTYGVAYLIVGQTERNYPEIDRGCVPREVTSGIATIESMVGTSLEVAFQQGTTTVYRVLR